MPTKILIIDDSDDLREDVVEMLQLENYEVVSAADGDTGIELAKSFRPDLILCDIMMPGTNGFEVLKAIRADAKTAVIPFIFLTAKVERLSMRQGMVLGADDYITKPYKVDELLKSIDTQLKKRADLNEAANKHLDELRHSISMALPHELRTPLNTIMGFSEMLQSESQHLKPDQIYDWATQINTAAYRIYHIFENYIAYSRVQIMLHSDEDTRPDSALEEWDFNAQAKVMQIAQKHERFADLQAQIDPVPDLHIRAEDAERLVQELVDNAFKFSQAGDSVEVYGQATSDMVYTLSVRDAGSGLTREQFDQAGAYLQYDRHLVEQQGMGFGLAIVKGLLALYDYDCDVDGTPDEGTCISIHMIRG